MSLAVTEYEHRAIHGVKAIRERAIGEKVAISDLLRDNTVAQLVDEYEQMRTALNGADG